MPRLWRLSLSFRGTVSAKSLAFVVESMELVWFMESKVCGESGGHSGSKGEEGLRGVRRELGVVRAGKGETHPHTHSHSHARIRTHLSRFAICERAALKGILVWDN